MNKDKQKKKETKISKKRQLLTTFHPTIDFLKILTEEDLTLLEEKIHLFVFSRGNLLAKEKQPIDYIGLIVEGRAVQKGKQLSLGEMIGAEILINATQYHVSSISAESDGIILALRVDDIFGIGSVDLKNKIIAKCTEKLALQMRPQMQWQESGWEEIEEKLVLKQLPAEWIHFYEELDPKERLKWNTYFPFKQVKQKSSIINQCTHPYLLLVVTGELILKAQGDQKTLKSQAIHNAHGFLAHYTPDQNIYCLSSQAVILLIDKSTLITSFSTIILQKVLTIAMSAYSKSIQTSCEVKSEGELKEWSLFKKNPNFQIIPLPKKQEPSKSAKTKAFVPISSYQTLFREQLSSEMKEGRTTTKISLAESGIEKLYTIKTEIKEPEWQNTAEIEKLRKEILLSTEKLKQKELAWQELRLDLIESRAKTAKYEVHKQILKMRSGDQIIRNHENSGVEVEGSKAISLKSAFENQLRSNWIRVVVAKFAFRWLYLTRKSKAEKK